MWPLPPAQAAFEVCGNCDMCLKLSNSDCKTGKSHDTQSECEAQGANYEWCGDPEPTPRPTAEPTPSCYDYCEAWFGAGTPGPQCYNCYGANKCVDVAGSHCYYADNGTATCTAAGHIYC